MAAPALPPSRISITRGPDSATVVIPELRVWLYILPVGAATAFLVFLLCALLRALVLDLFDGKFSFGGTAAFVLLAAFTSAFGYALLSLIIGRQVLRLSPGTVSLQAQNLGGGLVNLTERFAPPEVYSSPVKEVRVEPSVRRGEWGGGSKQVAVEFQDESVLTIWSTLDDAEAELIADTIRTQTKVQGARP